MSDLRTRLAEPLGEHRFEPCSISQPGYLEWWGRCAACGFEGKKRNMRGPEWELNMHSDEVDHQLDVLLSLPGIAIVELPEGVEWAGEDWSAKPLPRDTPFIRVAVESPLFPDGARDFAAALLAAAAAAEKLARQESNLQPPD